LEHGFVFGLYLVSLSHAVLSLHAGISDMLSCKHCYQYCTVLSNICSLF